MDLWQIVPALPPAADGLGGYAASLAPRLAALLRGEARFVVGDPAWQGKDGGALAVPERAADTLAGLLPERDGAVLVQYAGYGYQARGCPAWLVDGLVRWRRQSPAGRSPRLVTFFHEVYASGPPWRSSFWLSPAQRRLAARLLHLSDAAVTSLGLYARLLGRWRPRAAPAVLPVVSNVGEPARVPPLAARPRRLAVFGGAGNRSRVYTRHLAELAEAGRALGAEEIVDVGPPVPSPASAAGIPIVRLGALPAERVSAELLRCTAGFLAYPAAFLPKSGVFAAFCAHGLATVCMSAAPPGDGLRPGEHYLPATAPLRPEALQAAADAARAWYAGHALDRHAALLHGLLA